jgi:hypothetical protein
MVVDFGDLLKNIRIEDMIGSCYASYLRDRKSIRDLMEML